MKLPNADRAVIDAAKLRGYCLNADHPRGKQKARVFSRRATSGSKEESMSEEVKLLDVVALTGDLPAKGLRRGQVGTIVEVVAPGVFEVEFCDHEGRTWAMATLPARELIVLVYEPRAA